MIDAYSFHANKDSLSETYGHMRDAYTRIFSRCGLSSFPAEADGGATGGDECHEFMVAAADVGEDAILSISNLGMLQTVSEPKVLLLQPSSWDVSAAN